MLFIDFDIQGSLITNPAVSLAGAVSQLPLTKTGTANEGLWRTPDGLCLMIQPVQLTGAWPSTAKFQLGDYRYLSGLWEQQARRASGDYFLHSLSIATPIASLYQFPRNVGFFVESWFYSPPETFEYCLFDMCFGKYFTLFLGSDGTVEVFDSRSPGAPIGSGKISSGPIMGKFVQIGILPYRRNRILIWSNLGGYFSFNVPGAFVDGKQNKADWSTVGASPAQGLNVITEAGTPSFFSQCSPPAACFNFSPLMYDDVGGGLTTVAYQSAVPLASQPSLNIAQGDDEMGTQIELSDYAPWSSSPPFPTNWAYVITMLSSNGIAGLGALAGNAAIGDSSLYTPFDYYNRVDVDRTLGTSAYTTNTIPGTKILGAELKLDKDRGKTTFSFLLDNPGDMWTALKDMENRRMRAYLDMGQNHGLPSNPNDPDIGIVAAAGGPITIFEGYSDKIDFKDGHASRVQVDCVGMVKRLRRYLMSSCKDYDGVAHTTAVSDVLKIAGFVAAADVSEDFPQLQIYIYDDGINMPLPASGSADEPAWRPKDGVTAEEFLQQIIDWSGWDLFEAGGIWYYVPRDFEIASLLARQGVITIGMANTLLSENGGTVGQSVPNCNVVFIAALDEPAVHQSSEEIVADDIYVIGMNADGNPLVARYVDQGLMNDRTRIAWIGDRWIFMLINSSLATQAAVNTVCAMLATKLTKPTRMVELSLPDFRLELPINAPVHVDNYGDGLVVGISCSFGDESGGTGDSYRKTGYLVELV